MISIRVSALALALAAGAYGQRYHAKIVAESGSALPGTPQITVGMSTRLVPLCRILNVFGNGTVEYYMNWNAGIFDRNSYDKCPITIRLPGFQTTQGTLSEGGAIIVKREGDHEGATVSITTLKAPEEARKAYAKGERAAAEKKWPAAQKQFEKAVEIYPEYAQAWSDLGEVLRQQSQGDGARDAYRKAVAADPKYFRAYLQLARLALAEGKMDEADRITSQALELNPLDFPGLFFYNAVANYNLRRMDVAEKSARRTIELDGAHEIPRAENLLGSVLAMKGDIPGALAHLRKYLELSPKADDATQVRGLIAQLEARTARPN